MYWLFKDHNSTVVYIFYNITCTRNNNDVYGQYLSLTKNSLVDISLDGLIEINCLHSVYNTKEEAINVGKTLVNFDTNNDRSQKVTEVSKALLRLSKYMTND